MLKRAMESSIGMPRTDEVLIAKPLIQMDLQLATKRLQFIHQKIPLVCKNKGISEIKGRFLQGN